MQLNLDIADLRCLLFGVNPNYIQIIHLESVDLGRWSEVINKWIWNRDSISKFTESELWALYQQLKNNGTGR